MEYRLDLPLDKTQELLEDWLERRSILDREIAALKHRRDELRAEFKRQMRPSLFRIVGYSPVKSTRHRIVRKVYGQPNTPTGTHGIQHKMAQYWATFEQVDDCNQPVRRWCVPVATQGVKYPDFLKSRFIAYQIHVSEMERFTAPPAWMGVAVEPVFG